MKRALQDLAFSEYLLYLVLFVNNASELGSNCQYDNRISYISQWVRFIDNIFQM